MRERACTYGANADGAASSTTSQDCPAERGGGAYEAPLGDRLSPLTTETSTLTGASRNFCPSQKTAGAFLVTGVQCVKETGPLPATWPTARRTPPS